MNNVEKLKAIANQKIWDIDKIEPILKECTIFDRIEFSGITREMTREKIRDLEERQVPGRAVLLEMDSERVAECWFKNWLHPRLKRAVSPSPRDKQGCSAKVLARDARRDTVSFYELGQQNFDYSLQDVREWLAKEEGAENGGQD